MKQSMPPPTQLKKIEYDQMKGLFFVVCNQFIQHILQEHTTCQELDARDTGQAPFLVSELTVSDKIPGKYGENCEGNRK